MTTVFFIVFILTETVCFYFYFKKLNKKVKQNDCYKSIVYEVLNQDQKTRTRIEKLCNDYLEHKVINSSFVNENYLDQIKLLLDDLKYINAIKAIEPFEENKKESKIEKAINENNESKESKKNKKEDK